MWVGSCRWKYLEGVPGENVGNGNLKLEDQLGLKPHSSSDKQHESIHSQRVHSAVSSTTDQTLGIICWTRKCIWEPLRRKRWLLRGGACDKSSVWREKGGAPRRCRGTKHCVVPWNCSSFDFLFYFEIFYLVVFATLHCAWQLKLQRLWFLFWNILVGRIWNITLCSA